MKFEVKIANVPCFAGIRLKNFVMKTANVPYLVKENVKAEA